MKPKGLRKPSFPLDFRLGTVLDAPPKADPRLRITHI